MNIASKYKSIAALDIGGTRLKACVFQNGVPSEVVEGDTNAKTLGAKGVLEKAAELLRSLPEFEVLGVSTAGQVDFSRGLIRYANENLPGYTGMNVRDFFGERFGVKVAVENDVNAAALGEWVAGAAQNQNNCLCLTYGTGVGGAIIIDGRLYRGSDGSAGEFGAMLIHPEDRVPGDCFSGGYERYASATALLARAKALDSAIENGRILFGRLEEPAVKEVVDGWLEEVALGLCSLIHIFNPGCILLGGGVMEQSYAVDGAKERVFSRIVPSFKNLEIKGTALGNQAGLFGAAWLANQL